MPRKSLGDLLDEYAAHQPNEQPRIDRIKGQLDIETRLDKLTDQVFKDWQTKRLEAVSESSVLRDALEISEQTEI